MIMMSTKRKKMRLVSRKLTQSALLPVGVKLEKMYTGSVQDNIWNKLATSLGYQHQRRILQDLSTQRWPA
jgi:hypothetical protein